MLVSLFGACWMVREETGDRLVVSAFRAADPNCNLRKLLTDAFEVTSRAGVRGGVVGIRDRD